MANINDYFRASTGAGKIRVCNSSNAYDKSTHGRALMIQVVDDVVFSAYTHRNAAGLAVASNVTFPAGTLVPCDVSAFTISSGIAIVYLAGGLSGGFTSFPEGVTSESDTI